MLRLLSLIGVVAALPEPKRSAADALRALEVDLDSLGVLERRSSDPETAIFNVHGDKMHSPCALQCADAAKGLPGQGGAWANEAWAGCMGNCICADGDNNADGADCVEKCTNGVDAYAASEPRQQMQLALNSGGQTYSLIVSACVGCCLFSDLATLGLKSVFDQK